MMHVQLVASLSGHADSVWCCVWSPDGRTLATCGTDKAIRLWSNPALEKGQDQKEDARTTDGGWKCVTILSDGHSRTVRRVAWSPCGQMLASCSFDGTVCIWTLKEGEFECTITLEGHENEVKAVEFSSSGRYLATCSRDKTVWIWERDPNSDDEYECVSVQSCHTQDVKCVRWHPSEDLLASASYDNSINFYRDEGDDWVCEFTAASHDSTVWSIDFNRDGSRLVSGSDDRTVRIWKRYETENNVGVAPSWKVISTIQGFHPRPIYTVSWCPNTGLIATGCGDNNVRIFAPDPEQISCETDDAPNFLQAALIQAHTQDVNCVAWNPKRNGLLATSGDDETIKLWQISDYDIRI
ncbi:probable cytosolic iron-sulfur protein assembly protein CIAO1 [Varroa jacobsoni]|uniref:probable cytosolic iron-sulfur protein assembly protein CIAO1 n=1 Tax=Varroa jacobsoni TaxID=62625 RepID=UPI000BF72EA1|nr:probable cytosolic iron-sulfur protein assembly protein CIAO1 [Varroa jacobsoni]